MYHAHPISQAQHDERIACVHALCTLIRWLALLALSVAMDFWLTAVEAFGAARAIKIAAVESEQTTIDCMLSFTHENHKS